MRTAIAITLLVAGLTSALGAYTNYKRYRTARSSPALIVVLVSAAFALWFIAAAYWSATHS